MKLEGKSVRYAKTLASKMADYYGDQYSLSSQIKHDKSDLHKENEIREKFKMN